MKKFAQIVDNTAYWIFETEEFPSFAPNIVLLDITGRDEVQEGWGYNVATNTFTDLGNPVVVAPLTQADIQDLKDSQQIIKDGMADIYLSIYSIPGVE